MSDFECEMDLRAVHVAIVDTGVANTASVRYAFERLGVSCQLTQDASTIQKSTHVVLPGVGTAVASMKKFRASELDALIRDLKQPVLGICLGMQLFFEESEEGRAKENSDGQTKDGKNIACLGVLPGKVQRMKVSLSVPHMGWNQVRSTGNSIPSKLLAGIPENSYFYFVHSYVAPSEISGEFSVIKAVADYETAIPAVIESGNWFGTQFHPERSGGVGLELLRNFVRVKV